MSPSASRLTRCVNILRECLPALQAVYLFGSQASGQHETSSDVDLAILLPAPLGAYQRWELAERVAELLNRDVDLVDLRCASTVMQHQVVEHGRRLWSGGTEADEFELTALSEYWDLAILRHDLLDDIQQRGSIHGR
ncbi:MULTISPECIES: nucleotidyltransferase domain-containing protein [unclassified Modicisalibacter]|uniref:type VII toxin-antitoxin system MntA family adenylyltransferase antitoxin n=1 Tax=unclassified Modicisalibacter TaxID=2679913 RepID=UPI001CCF12CF|nr:MULTISPECIES: nucleotidyltransferase domain-containing protein [unclassified Modicisalibacter]MBZ9559613.1 nucleotidyltransferase domain-containing protein [Modicisalibacter sp. R2A 31.J]MBZ9577065.1 nucleotidyltransferase domain-containing protein [Modicisalibacter sp. MOD 31.J]